MGSYFCLKYSKFNFISSRYSLLALTHNTFFFLGADKEFNYSHKLYYIDSTIISLWFI